MFSSIKSVVEHKLNKFPKQLDIPKDASVEIASFFIDMEKLFGSESIINELEEDESDIDEDEDQYNKNFMNELQNNELDYAKNRRDSHSPEAYGNKFKSSYTHLNSKNNRVKPFTDLSKLKASGSQNNKEFIKHKYSPYAEAEKRLTNQLKNKSKVSQSQKKVNANISGLKK